MRDEQAVHGTGDTYVGQSAFLFHLVGIGECTMVWEHPFFHADQEHIGEFEAFGGVQGHHHHAILATEFIGVGNQRHLL